MVQSVIDLLGSPEVAIDDRHGPKLYSRFLEKLLAKPMAKLEPTSPPVNGSPLPRVKTSGPTRASSGSGPTPSSKQPFDYNNIVFDYPSPSTNGSLSPPPTAEALSFDTFAPVGGADPFVHNMRVTSDTSNVSSLGDLFHFDDIVQDTQTMMDSNEWQDQDLNLPGIFCAVFIRVRLN